MSNHKIVLHSDNEATVYVINKLTSKDQVMMNWLRRLVFLGMKHNIMFRARHVPGLRNSLADSLSRFKFQEAFKIAPHLKPMPIQVPVHLWNL